MVYVHCDYGGPDSVQALSRLANARGLLVRQTHTEQLQTSVKLFEVGRRTAVCTEHGSDRRFPNGCHHYEAVPQAGVSSRAEGAWLHAFTNHSDPPLEIREDTKADSR